MNPEYTKKLLELAHTLQENSTKLFGEHEDNLTDEETKLYGEVSFLCGYIEALNSEPKKQEGI